MTQQTTTAPAVASQEEAVATEPQILMAEVVDGRQMTLEWRADGQLWLVVDDRECQVNAWRVVQLLRQYARKPDGDLGAAVVDDLTANGHLS